MPKSRIPSPARSQGVISTPRKQLRRTGSVDSPVRTNLPLSTIIDSYKVSPVPNRQSVLTDDTYIEMPRRGSWWKKIDDNSRDVLELLERKELVEINNFAEEFDVEVLSQENKNHALDLPESSDGESINSIIIPHRKLFTQKDNRPQIQFGQIKNNRETLQKINKSYVDQDKELNIGRKTLFGQHPKPRTKPVFPAALLNISANTTANKSKELAAVGEKGQVRILFGGRPGTKRKNIFADFIVSESEDEISDIQPKVFAFQKRNDQKRRASSMSPHSPTSSIDLEMEDWRLLPSSTMVENQIDEATSPVKRIKLSNLLKTKESEKSLISNNTLNKTKHANKSVSSENKSKNLSNIHLEGDTSFDIPMTPKNATTNNSRVTRSMARSLGENSVNAANISKNFNKSKNQTQSKESNELKTSKTMKHVTQIDSDKIKEKDDMLIAVCDPDEDFTLEYDNDNNDNNEVVQEIGTLLKNVHKSHKDRTASNLNVDIIVDQNNLVNESRGKISKENLVEMGISTSKMCENEEELLENKQSDIDSNKVSNYSKLQNNSKVIDNVIGLNKESTIVQKLNRSIEKNKSKSITDFVENYEEHSRVKDVQKKTFSQEQSVNENIEQNETLEKSTEKLNEENPEDQEIQSNNEDDQNNYEKHSDIEEEANESTEVEENSEIEEESNEDDKENDRQSENISEEESNNEEQEETNGNDTNERGKEIILDKQSNIEDKLQVTLPNVSHDTTGRNRKEIKSPEVILHNKTKQIDSFTVQGRNTSVRKTKSIIFHNKLDTIADSRRSTGFSDAAGNSSAEGSGWDSHRTTRKTLRQTFGRDFTPRKSLRALVMEKTAKLQANFTDVVDITKIPQANSTEYDQVQDELDSSQETEHVQVEQNIKIAQAEDRIESIHVKEHVTERLEERDKTLQLEEKDRSEQIEARYVADHSISVERDETEQSEEREAAEQSEKRDEPKHFEEKEVEESEEEEEKVDDSEEEEAVEESEEREEMGETKEREEMEESGEREEMEESEGKEEVEQSKAREVVEESEEGEEMEQSDESDVMEESEKEEDENEQSEEREVMDQSEEGEEMEQSEEREQMEQSEESEEMEQSEEREEVEQSGNEDGDETEQFDDRDEVEQSQNEIDQLEERDETVADDEIMAEVSDLEVSKQTRQTTLEIYLQKFKQDNAEKRRKMQEELRNSLKNVKRDAFNVFKIPQRPVRRTIKIQKAKIPKAKQIKSIIPLEMLPSELIEDMKYKPPKRFQPNNASWITKRLYKFLENKLEPKYDYKARIRAEKLVQCMYNFTKEVRRHDSVRSEGIEELKREMARLDIVKTHFDFYEFCDEFFPREIRIKVVPDIVNNIQLPRHGVFSDIL